MYKIKKLAAVIAITYLSLYIPLTFTIYALPWYTWNTPDQSIVLIGSGTISAAHSDLTQFFLHRQDLNPVIWNQSEILHMRDVREIYDTLFFLGLIAITALIMILVAVPPKHRRQFLARTTKIARFLPAILLIILPFFSYFWTHIFHTLLFTNNLWIITSSDISYHLFPLQFFINALIFTIFTASITCFTVHKITSAP